MNRGALERRTTRTAIIASRWQQRRQRDMARWALLAEAVLCEMTSMPEADAKRLAAALTARDASSPRAMFEWAKRKIDGYNAACGVHLA